MRISFIFLIMVLCISCDADPIPKPRAFLRLDYPQAEYGRIKTNLPFVFEKNTLSKSIDKITISGDQNTIGFEIVYPSLKGTLFLTYMKINPNNLPSHIADAQYITQTHATKASGIIEQVFVNSETRVFGSLFEVDGNAASQSQFYVTDSVNNFLTGALYFHAKPNFDSILPAANYLKKDIQHIMETLKWEQ